MLRIVRKGLLARQYLHRGIIIIFFFLTLVDMASPQNCGEDVWGFLRSGPSHMSVMAPSDFGPDDVCISVDTSQHQSSSDPERAEDDCICCCSHILPSVIFHVDELGFAPSLSEPTITALPTAPPQSAFHPPRLS